jgi:hypothetical protein
MMDQSFLTRRQWTLLGFVTVVLGYLLLFYIIPAMKRI